MSTGAIQIYIHLNVFSSLSVYLYITHQAYVQGFIFVLNLVSESPSPLI